MDKQQVQSLIDYFKDHLAMIRADKIEVLSKVEVCEWGFCEERTELVKEQDLLGDSQEDLRKYALIQGKIRRLEEKNKNNLTVLNLKIRNLLGTIEILEEYLEEQK